MDKLWLTRGKQHPRRDPAPADHPGTTRSNPLKSTPEPLIVRGSRGLVNAVFRKIVKPLRGARFVRYPTYMASKKKHHDRSKPRAPKSSLERIRFEIESNAEELMQQALEATPASHEPRTEPNALRIRHPQAAESIEDTIDLHGLTVDEACTQLRVYFNARRVSLRGKRRRFRIITGKGRRSGPRGGVLVREVYSFVRREYAALIRSIDAPPAEAELGGLPLRGHFDVTLEFP